MNDGNIQRLLLAAAHEDNPAVRVESVDLLRSQSGSTEVRDALLNVLSQDSNPGVRLKALEGLKPLAADAEVRKTLRRVLLTDDNVAVRMQVIDLLVAHRDDNDGRACCRAWYRRKTTIRCASSWKRRSRT